MQSSEATRLHCPIRGQLQTRQRASDGLTFTEEKQRIDAIRYLIQRGYPKSNFGVETTLFKIGNSGRNAFRTDFAIYDTAYDDVRGKSVEQRLEHVRLLAEIKRDNALAEQAKATQVRAALHLVPDLETLGVYWDDVEQRFFYRRIEGKRSSIHDAPISKIPDWGSDVGSTKLAYDDLEPTKDLVRIFDEIENAVHVYVVDKPERYILIQQLLLLKIHDETTHRAARRRAGALAFQDFSTEALSDADVVRRMNEALSTAAAHYNRYLPEGKKIGEKFRCRAEVLRNATKILAPVNILGSKIQVIQQFYMKFAKSLYKWDLAQYFTPHEVIDFIVELANPTSGEHVYDPACGSADFLVSSFRRSGMQSEPCVWGADNSEQAVQISILNMVLNGDGKTQIKHQDSLATYTPQADKFATVLCNPPFGTKIVERRFEVLRHFDLGHKWVRNDDGGVERTDEARASQQTGILFAELCVKLAKPGTGRVGIILPNGYLGNRGVEYLALREWLLRHARIVAIVAFPRFTFKKSGADVSASAILLERRAKPLDRAADSKDYSFFVGNIESVGWRVGDKKAVPMYLRDQETGDLILSPDNEPILEADFDRVLSEFLRSPTVDCFPWTTTERDVPAGPQTAGVDIGDIVATSDLSLDPKRLCSKFLNLRRQIESGPHFAIGDVLEPVNESAMAIEAAQIYRYVEIQNIGAGDCDHEELRGWQLPDRAKLPAAPGDFFVAAVWSSVGKWFLADEDCSNVVVTNGCTRLRIKPGQEDCALDVMAGLCSEAFRVQMRGLATGSDGLAEISTDDILKVVLPRIPVGSKDRKELEAVAGAFLKRDLRFSRAVSRVLDKLPGWPKPELRKDHWILV